MLFCCLSVIMNTMIALGLIIFAISKCVVDGQLYEGDNCVTKQTNENGVCQFLSNCPKAKEGIRKGQYPTPCGFQGNEIIVCCPPTVVEKTKTRQVGEISEKMCANYSEYVWTIEASPLLLVGADDIKRRECPFDRQELVVGGEPASRREFPHMVQLGYDSYPDIKWACGGSLISIQYVLTAAHCLDDISLGPIYYARMGMVNIDDPSHVQQFNVTQLIPHPEYEAPAHYHDIGLVKLHKPALLNTWVRPICLYKSSKSPWTNVLATGWGRKEFAGPESDKLLRVILELYDQSKCNNVYQQETAKLNQGINDTLMICAGHSKKLRDTCQGDSGGPLQVYRIKDGNLVPCMYDLIGVTSFGKACGIAVNFPGVYTRVAYYLKWIEDHVWPE